MTLYKTDQNGKVFWFSFNYSTSCDRPGLKNKKYNQKHYFPFPVGFYIS